MSFIILVSQERTEIPLLMQITAWLLWKIKWTIDIRDTQGDKHRNPS